MPDKIEQAARGMRCYAEMCKGYSPLYAALAPRISEDREILALAATVDRGQPAGNLLLAAVHYLLLGGAEHPLAAFYPSVGGSRPPGDAFPAFAAFCREFREPIVELGTTRRVQTNEVGRCGLLLPAVALAWERFDRRPLHLIDIGASCGLNLLLDRYQYIYTADPVCPTGERVCGPPSPVRIHTELRDGAAAGAPSRSEGRDGGRTVRAPNAERAPQTLHPRQSPTPYRATGWGTHRGTHAPGCGTHGKFPMPSAMPTIADRVGIDITPVDVTDTDAVRWVEAMIWPDQLDRIELFRAAIALARQDRPRVLAGDALDLLPGMVKRVPDNGPVCVFHSHAIYQMSGDWRERFAALLSTLGREHDLVQVSLEWLKDDPRPQLHLIDHTGGEPRTTRLADCHHHGGWMRWLGV